MGKIKLSLILFLSLILGAALYLSVVIFQNHKLFTEHFDPKEFEKKYNQSQWIIANSKNPISDEILYTYEGYQYIHGFNPIYLNAEVPPLGKYLIGLSIIIFNNHRVISLLTAISTLLVLFFLVYFVTNSLISSSIALFLTSINYSLIDQFVHSPQLDIFQLFFLLIFLIFFLDYLKNKNKVFLFLAGIFLGGFVSTKFFLLYFSIIEVVIVAFYLQKRYNLRRFVVDVLTLDFEVSLIYLLTYLQFFLKGGTFREFLGVQKWIALFYKGSSIDISKLLGSYLSLIFFNQYKFWSKGYPVVHYQYWSVLWPIIFIFGLYSIFKLIKNNKNIRQNNLIIFLAGFLVVYNMFLFVTPLYPRYLLLLFVPLNMSIGVYFGRIIEYKLKSV